MGSEENYALANPCLQRGMGYEEKLCMKAQLFFFDISTLFDKIISFLGDFDPDSDPLKIYFMIDYVINGSKLDVSAEKYALLLTFNRKNCRITSMFFMIK